MRPWPVHQRLLVGAAAGGFVIFLAGVWLALLAEGIAAELAAAALGALGSAIMFPVLVSFAYDRLRERWLGDEVWRLFSELGDAGIVRIYGDREFAADRENAQTRLAEEFERLGNAERGGEVLMIGPTLRVFFHPLGPHYRDIEAMLRNAGGRVTIRALVARRDSPAMADRAAVEEPGRAAEERQSERDAASTIAQITTLSGKFDSCVALRRFMLAPYCTAVIFPHLAFFSPNLLARVVPVRLPMILFRSGSHGYDMIRATFAYAWEHEETMQVLPEHPTPTPTEHLRPDG
jgi:hypothetical protein